MKTNDTSSNEIINRMIDVDGMPVLIDRDVAMLYGVETKHINQAVKNNPDKFPEGYVITLDKDTGVAVKNNDRKTNNPKSRYAPKAFTEKGLYMLATILRSDKATQATLKIIEAYANMRELSRTVSMISQESDDIKRKQLGEKSGSLLSKLLSEDLSVSEEEFSIEVNLMALKLTKTIRRTKKE